MHSIANLGNIADPFSDFFPQKSAQTLFSLQESPGTCRASARSCFPSTRTHLSLSLYSVSIQHTHTHLSLSLSPHLLSFCSAHAHTHLPLSLRLLSFCSARAHTSLSASAQFQRAAEKSRA